jgi:hypothetical protein
MRLHPDVENLLAAMRALEQRLVGYADFWADHVRRAADDVAKSDAHGVRRFLGLFAGAGSLNDLVLHREGKPLQGENDQLDVLRARAWELAYAMRHEAD